MTLPSSPTIRRRTLTALSAGAATLAVALPAAAVTVTIGNPATDRTTADTWTDFTAVDTNRPAPYDGYFTEIDYYAENPGEIRFVVVDATDVVTWVSAPITVDAAGAAALELDEPVGVTAGSNLGVYSAGYGVISFDFDDGATPASFENYGSGVPTLGESLNYALESDRVYSMNAPLEASSPQICKDGGWESWGYANQGQCIASVVANENSGH